MKTVTILIEVEVPDDTTHVACDSAGRVEAFDQSGLGYPPRPAEHVLLCYFEGRKPSGGANVTNWRETLTEVNG